MVACPACRASCEEDAAFCGGCGRRLPGRADAGATQGLPPARLAELSAASPGVDEPLDEELRTIAVGSPRRKAAGGAALLGVAGALLAGGGVWLAHRPAP